MRTQRARAGFTLVELMIATIAGAIAVAGIYYLSGVSSRMFGEQMRVSETQMSLRSAMEQVRRDFARAGYLGTSNSNNLPDCSGARPGTGVTPSDRWLRSIAIVHNGSKDGSSDPNALLGSPGTNKTRYDAVTLWGNYATADAYLTDPTTTTTTLITFQTNSESFRRSFFDPATPPAAATYNEARFKSAFEGRVLRVEHEGRVFFRDIKTVNATGPNPSLLLDTALPPCFDPTRWAAVAPIMRIRYALETDSQSADMKRMRPTTAAGGKAPLGSQRTFLVRRELNPTVDAATVVAGRSRMILDYAVEFAVDAISQVPGGSPPWSYALDKDSLDAASAAPENIRSVVVTLSSRSAEADPRLPSIPRARFGDSTLFNSPLATFQVIDPAYPSVVAHARVRTLRSEIYLQNQ